jgi:mannitol/fructose-specific phosphotransferase system IIA component (Ntr-type)
VIRLVLRLEKPARLSSFLTTKSFIRRLSANDRTGVITELCTAVSSAANLDRQTVELAVLDREAIMPTGIGNGLAVPHARLDGLTAPILGLGLSEQGVDFDAPDGEPARVVFLILSPREDGGAQVKVLAEIARTFSKPGIAQEALKVQSLTELLALLKTTEA